MNMLRASGFAVLVALLPTAPLAQSRTGHDAFHEFYRGLRSPEGESCCNEKDCRPVQGRYVREGGAYTLEILIGTRWIKVPKDRILPEPSPDGAVHACYSDPAPFMTETAAGLIIRCVIIGGFS
ncbi:MAG TPA: hypothetical protein VEK55_00080 [Xanthobacteraceae bacterium]|nr:hypothetical protein [Xanthobacteraceae bacterium]